MLTMGNLARIAKVVALLLFILPWVTISCAETPLMTMSGVDLITGHVTMTNPMTGTTEAPPGAGGREWLVVIAAGLILLSLAVTFVIKGGTSALIAAAGSAGAAACLAYAILVKLPVAARSGATSDGGASAAGGPSPEQIQQMIHVDVQIGFWLVLAALAAAVVLNVLAMRGGAAPAVAVPAPPAEPTPPRE